MFENGRSGPLRLINAQLGGQAGWLLALAMAGAAAALWHVGPRQRRDRRWHNMLLWSAWLLPAGAFFSIAGFFHSYYLVMLAPPAAALAAIGLVVLWRAGRDGGWRAWLLPAALAGSAVLQVTLLRPYPGWRAWLVPAVAGLGLVAAGAVLVIHGPRGLRRQPAALTAASALVVLAVFLAPALWSMATVRSTGGMLPAGGPQLARGPGGPPATADAPRAALGDTERARIDGGAGASVDGGRDGGAPAPFLTGSPGGGGPASAALIRYLETNRDGTTFLVATPSSQTASPIILATGEPVMALGGFSGGDPILTAEAFMATVQSGTVRFVLAGGPGGAPGAGPAGSPAAGTSVRMPGGTSGDVPVPPPLGAAGGPGGEGAVMRWVTQACTPVPSSTVGATGGGQLYDCAAVRSLGG